MTRRWSRGARSRHLIGTLSASAAFLVVLCLGAAAVFAMRAAGGDAPTQARAQDRVQERAAVADAPAPKPARTFSSTLPVSSTAAPAVMLASNTAVADAGPEQHPPVTIAGCLEQDGDAFRLTHTSGTETPKARSWKSGFLRKHTAPVTVVDAGQGLKLPSHVGHHVSVTGVLDDRDIHARAVQNTAGSCS